MIWVVSSKGVFFHEQGVQLWTVPLPNYGKLYGKHGIPGKHGKYGTVHRWGVADFFLCRTGGQNFFAHAKGGGPEKNWQPEITNVAPSKKW